MSKNHIDVFLENRDEVDVQRVGERDVIRLGDSVKIYFSGKMTLDSFMDRINTIHDQLTARAKAKDAFNGRTNGLCNTPESAIPLKSTPEKQEK